ARLISPGRPRRRPPTSAGIDALLWGDRNGRRRRILPPVNSPATEATIETSSASDGCSGGRIPARQAPSNDLPEPGGPLISKLWPPAAAISSARLATSCPLTCARSGPPPGGSAPATT